MAGGTEPRISGRVFSATSTFLPFLAGLGDGVGFGVDENVTGFGDGAEFETDPFGDLREARVNKPQSAITPTSSAPPPNPVPNRTELNPGGVP
jgi:hypothetical protein